ncbi:membrane associated rhomboid family serine protease [Deinococcus metalli]|uniref:Membrane associated rhomboid family serine protease n=1 Tax=Deinococcus metalli TaxID=1141878 RepID=A0A7W8NQI2_9DEIO|nr:rhomboid family intramembrane serine protease [Deinococcus metalli]MBB5377916.1 membrane associated rhomboid family serine protease [Deinococcus metalli]
MRSPAPPPRPGSPLVPPRRAPQVRPALTLTAALIAGVWGQEVVDSVGFGGRLDAYGIEPRVPGTFWHVLTAPFLHAGFAHLIANTVPLAVLTFMGAVRNVWRFVAALMIIAVLGGALVWLFGRGGSVHLGASELIFGLLAYLLGVGWWERTPVAIGVAALAFALYGGILWGVLPGNPYVSWESHLFGFVAGLVAALLLHGRRPRRAALRG